MGAELKLYSFTSGLTTGATTGSQTVAMVLVCGLNSGNELVPLRTSSEGVLLTGSFA